MSDWKHNPFSTFRLVADGKKKFKFVSKICSAQDCQRAVNQNCSTMMCAKCCLQNVRNGADRCPAHAPKRKRGAKAAE